MEKLDGKTMDIVQDNIEKLKQIFPEVFLEEKIDFEKLQLTLGEHIETEKERYQFTWNGKTDAIQMAQKQSTGTLRPCKEESVNWDTTQNLYIEGDNLEILRLLQNSYRNKVKMIYVDPPYNTGKDFVYKDNFHDNVKYYKKTMDQSFVSNPETNGRYHTNWLNMIYPRLKLARNLMTDDGVIFLSIDDNEMANIRKIMNEIFGEENLLAELVWDLGTGTQAGHFTRSHEYILAFAKNKLKLSNFSGGEGIIDDRANKKISVKNPSSQFEFPLGTKFEAEDGTEFSGEWGGSEKIKLIKGKMIAKNGELTESVTLEAGWVMKNQMKSWFEGEDTFDTKGQKVIDFYINKNGIIRYRKDRTVINPSTILKGLGSTKIGSNTVSDLLGKSDVFDFPKPVSLIKFLLGLIIEEDDLVLDFFAGSSTTAQALLELNAEKNVNHRFIMIQLDEETNKNSSAYKEGYKNISQLSRLRIAKSSEKIQEELIRNEVENYLDFGFKMFKLDETNLKIWDEEADNIEENLLFFEGAVKEGRSKEDVLYEILLKYGLDLTVPIEEEKTGDVTAYSIGMGYLIVCLDKNLSINDIEHLVSNYTDCARMVFLDNGFATDEVKINAEQILKRNGIKDIRVI